MRQIPDNQGDRRSDGPALGQVTGFGARQLSAGWVRTGEAVGIHVKPGHAEALKVALREMDNDLRNSKLAIVATGIQDMSCTVFDNDTRYLHATTFDTDWDSYIDDSVPGPQQMRMYANWLQHLEEAGDFGPDNLPTANDIKVLFNQQRVTATMYLRSFGETVVEQYKMTRRDRKVERRKAGDD